MANKNRVNKTGKTQQSATLRYKAVAREYCRNGFNKTAALEKVYGWKHKTAVNNTTNIFGDKRVQDEIERLLKAAQNKIEFGPEQVLEMLKFYAESGVTLAKFRKVNENGELHWDFSDATEEDLAMIHQLEVAEYVEGRGSTARKVKKFKIGSSDPLSALDKLARIYGMYNDSLKLDGEVSLVDRINAGRKRINKDGDDDPTS